MSAYCWQESKGQMTKELAIVNTATGELTTQRHDQGHLTPEQAATVIKYVTHIKTHLLEEGNDYQGETGGKPTILKPGAEKLLAFFRLYPSYKTVRSIEDHFMAFDYDAKDWETQEIVTKRARGFYHYEVSCIIREIGTDNIRCEAQGMCTSTERGRETSPANAVLKIAQKRALVAAALNATFSSGFFTQDMDDTDLGDAAPKKTRAASDSRFKATMKSKYGSEDKPSFCNFCKKSHIIAGEVVGQDQETGKWGATKCHKGAAPAPETKESSPERQEAPAAELEKETTSETRPADVKGAAAADPKLMDRFIELYDSLTAEQIKGTPHLKFTRDELTHTPERVSAVVLQAKIDIMNKILRS